MKKRDSRIRIRLFYSLLIVPTLLWILLSVTGLAKTLDYDTGEKRNSSELSEDLNVSNVTDELENYYNDRVPFRSIMLSVNSTLNYVVEIPYNAVIEPLLLKIANWRLDDAMTGSAAGASGESEAGSNPSENDPEGSGSDSTSGVHASSEDSVGDSASEDSAEGSSGSDSGSSASNGTGSSDSTSEDSDENEDRSDLPAMQLNEDGTLAILPAVYETPKESGYYPYKILADEVIQGRDGWLFTTESYEDYTGENMPDAEELNEKLNALVALNELCKQRGIEFHTFVLPNKNVVYPEYMPTLEQAEYSAANALEDYVLANSDVSFNYLDEELLGAKVYGQLYYKYDTHWNFRGGLAAYAYIRNNLGLSPIDLSEYEAVEGEETTGDLAQYTGLPSISFDKEYVLNMQYKPELEQTVVSSESDYIDEIICEGAENDKTVVIIGDSFRHGLLTFVSRDYTHTYSMDENKLDETMMEILKSADVIILETVERNIFSEVYYDNIVAGLGAVMQQ